MGHPVYICGFLTSLLTTFYIDHERDLAHDKVGIREEDGTSPSAITLAAKESEFLIYTHHNPNESLLLEHLRRLIENVNPEFSLHSSKT